MIIEPDFLDHWKTQLLIKLTGDPSAPLLMLRFWAFCQQRKNWRFTDLSNEALASICRWSREPKELRKFLIEASFLDEEQGEAGETILCAHDFGEVHSSYAANWKNGQKGGRPKNVVETQHEPNRAIGLTQSHPTENPIQNPPGNGETLSMPACTHAGTHSKPITPKSPSGGGRPRKAKISSSANLQPEPIRSRMLSLNALFRRHESTTWTEKEFGAFTATGLDRLSAEDFAHQLEPVSAYYGASIPREKNYRRRDLQTLLNNWPSEVDRAKLWQRENQAPAGGMRHL